MNRFRHETIASLSMKDKGFTLLEVMVVVVIIAIMAAAVGPNIIAAMKKAKIDRATVDITSIQGSLETYKLENHFYPSTDQGLDALVSKPSGDPEAKNWRQINKKPPIDPWDNHYKYLNPGTHGDIDIYSFGPDGIQSEDDIGNWTLKN